MAYGLQAFKKVLMALFPSTDYWISWKAFNIDFNWHHLATWTNITEQWPLRTTWIGKGWFGPKSRKFRRIIQRSGLKNVIGRTNPQQNLARCFQKGLLLHFFGGLECIGHSCTYVANFCIFESCLASNPESCRSKQARYQLDHLPCLFFCKKQIVIIIFFNLNSMKDILHDKISVKK